MAKTLFQNLNVNGSTITADRFYLIQGRLVTGLSTETNGQITMNQAGTFSTLTVTCSANTTTVCDVYIRKNLANTACTVNYTSNQTGTKQDLTHSFTIVAGDEVNYMADITSGASIGFRLMSTIFDSTTDSYSLFAGNGNTTIGQNDGLTNYYTITGLLPAGLTTETDTQSTMMCGGTFKHMYVFVTTNTKTENADFYVSINASTTGCPTIQYTSGQTGVKEDTSTTKASIDGDSVCFKCITAANAGTTTITFSLISCGYYTTEGKQTWASSSPTQTQAISTTRWAPVFANVQTQTTESLCQSYWEGQDCLVTELEAECPVNGNTANPSLTLDLRLETANAGLQLTWTASQTGTKSIIGNIRLKNHALMDIQYTTGGSGANVTINQSNILMMSDPFPVLSVKTKYPYWEIDENDNIG